MYRLIPRASPKKRKLREGASAAGPAKRRARLSKRFDESFEKHVHDEDKVQVLHSQLFSLSREEREQLREMPVMQQEHYFGAQAYVQTLADECFTADAALDIEHETMQSVSARRFARERLTYRRSPKGRMARMPIVPVPRPIQHSNAQGIWRPLRAPSVYASEHKIGTRRKFLKEKLGLVLSPDGVAAHIDPIRMGSHVMAAARKAGRLRQLGGVWKHHKLQLLTDAMRLTRAYGCTRTGIRAVSVTRDGNALENARDVATYLKGDHYEWLNKYIAEPARRVNAFAETTMVTPPPPGKGPECADVRTTIMLSVPIVDDEALELAGTSDPNAPVREGEAVGDCGGMFNRIELIEGGDIGNANDQRAIVSVVSKVGSCHGCNAPRSKWLDWKWLEANAKPRTDFQQLLLAHEDPDEVHGKVVVPRRPGVHYKCLAKGCGFVISPANRRTSLARFDAMTGKARWRAMRKQAATHDGVLPHRRSLLRNDAVKRAPSKLHFRINTVGTSLGVGLDYKSTPAQRAAMNRLLEKGNYHMRFAEPGVSAKTRKPAGPDCVKLFLERSIPDGETEETSMVQQLLRARYPDFGVEPSLEPSLKACADAMSKDPDVVPPRFKGVVPDAGTAAYSGGLAAASLSFDSLLGGAPAAEPAADPPAAADAPAAASSSARTASSAARTSTARISAARTSAEADASSSDGDDSSDDEEGGDGADDKALDPASDEEVEAVDNSVVEIGGWRTAAKLMAAEADALAQMSAPFNDSIASERSRAGDAIQQAWRKWADAVRDHHPTVLHYYMHSGGCHAKAWTEEHGQWGNVDDSGHELGNNRCNRIKRRNIFFTSADQGTFKQPRLVNAPGGGKEVRVVERAANGPVAEQLLSRQAMAAVLKESRPDAFQAGYTKAAQTPTAERPGGKEWVAVKAESRAKTCAELHAVAKGDEAE